MKKRIAKRKKKDHGTTKTPQVSKKRGRKEAEEERSGKGEEEDKRVGKKRRTKNGNGKKTAAASKNGSRHNVTNDGIREKKKKEKGDIDVAKKPAFSPTGKSKSAANQQFGNVSGSFVPLKTKYSFHGTFTINLN